MGSKDRTILDLHNQIYELEEEVRSLRAQLEETRKRIGIMCRMLQDYTGLYPADLDELEAMRANKEAEK